MAMVELKGLHAVKSKGRTYYYAWRGGPRIEAPYGSPEFHAEFAAARDPSHLLDTKKLGAWIARYKASDEFTGLADSTRRAWLPWLDRIQERFGGLSVKLFDRPEIRIDIRKWRDQWKTTPRTADYGKQVLSRVLTFCVTEGALLANPCSGVPNLYQGDRSEIIWEAADLERLCAVASREVAWAARLAALTGFRQGDCMRVSWSHVEAHAIAIRTGKSRKRRAAVAPITADLRALLTEIKQTNRGSTTILTNSAGRPWRGFNSSWTKAMADAWPEGRDLHFHDLRGTAATNYYRADFSIREIAEIMGWAEDRVERLIDRYVKRDEIMKDRIRRMEKSFTASK